MRKCQKFLPVLASKYSGNHKRIKHFLVRVNYLISKVDNGEVVFEKIATGLNGSDPLTKPLGPADFEPKRKLMLGDQPNL